VSPTSHAGVHAVGLLLRSRTHRTLPRLDGKQRASVDLWDPLQLVVGNAANRTSADHSERRIVVRGRRTGQHGLVHVCPQRDHLTDGGEGIGRGGGDGQRDTMRGPRIPHTT